MKAKKTVTIGGGNGTSVINETLLLSGVNYIKSVVTVMDSGGITGRMRVDTEGRQIAYSDALRTLLSLVDRKKLKEKQSEALYRLLRHRNPRDQDLGYTIFSHFYGGGEEGFSQVQSLLENLTGVRFRGEVIPATSCSTHIIFKTNSGRTFVGEDQLDYHRMSADMVKDIWLEPQVRAYGKAVEAVRTADTIVYSCGSLYGSVLCNFLPEGIKDALYESTAKKILVTNLASARNETHEFAPTDFIKVFRKFTGLDHPIDIMIVPETGRAEFEQSFPEVANRYALEHSFFLGWSKEELNLAHAEGVEIATHNATVIEPQHLTLRHDPKLLSKTFRKLLR